MRADRYKRENVVDVIGCYDRFVTAAIDLLREEDTRAGRKVLADCVRRLRMWKDRLRRLDRANARAG